MPSNADNLPGPLTAAPAASQENPVQHLEQLLGETIPPLITQARATFQRDLPQLLARHFRKWVAYSGDQRIGIGSSKTALYQECLRHGLAPGQFLVFSIEPELPREVEISLDV